MHLIKFTGLEIKYWPVLAGRTLLIIATAATTIIATSEYCALHHSIVMCIEKPTTTLKVSKRNAVYKLGFYMHKLLITPLYVLVLDAGIICSYTITLFDHEELIM